MVGLRPMGVYPALALTASVAAGLAQAYFAARCAFDASVFKQNLAEKRPVISNSIACWRLGVCILQALLPNR
jgi:hypothetical protein